MKAHNTSAHIFCSIRAWEHSHCDTPSSENVTFSLGAHSISGNLQHGLIVKSLLWYLCQYQANSRGRLRVEFLLKTDIGHPKDAGFTLFHCLLAKPPHLSCQKNPMFCRSLLTGSVSPSLSFFVSWTAKKSLDQVGGVHPIIRESRRTQENILGPTCDYYSFRQPYSYQTTVQWSLEITVLL